MRYQGHHRVHDLRRRASCWKPARSNIALLFVVGEERNSAGAIVAAAKIARGSKFLINGEPTENKLALGSKGALRLELTASGRMAHSAYPELGESAIEKLLDALDEVRRMPLPVDKILGAKHAEHRHHLRRPRAQRDSRPCAGRTFHPAGGRWRRHARSHATGRERQSWKCAKLLTHPGRAPGLAARF